MTPTPEQVTNRTMQSIYVGKYSKLAHNSIIMPVPHLDQTACLCMHVLCVTKSRANCWLWTIDDSGWEARNTQGMQMGNTRLSERVTYLI